MDSKLKPGIDEIIWKSKDIDKFIEDTQTTVERIDAVVGKMKS
jgi:hypothetical protein